MKDTKHILVITAALGLLPGLLLGLAGCDKFKNKAESLLEGGPTAKSLAEVSVIRVEASSCGAGIRAGLGERGFSTTTAKGKVDAVLEVAVTHKGRNFDSIPSFGGVGNKASYTATLRGAGDKVLFSTSGHQGSINMDELCGDIGDDIGDRLRSRKHG
jgi:hypothetical protein